MPFERVKPENLFKCQKCGKCCKGYGGTYVTDEDIEKISDFIGISHQQFKIKYCRLSNNKPLITQRTDGYCIFWDHLCTIHPVKPKMCKAWPFIPSVLIDPVNWNLMASICPGMQTDFSDEIIMECVRRKIKDVDP